MQSAREQEILTSKVGLIHRDLQSGTDLLCDFTLHWALDFLLHPKGSLRHTLPMGFVPYPKFGAGRRLVACGRLPSQIKPHLVCSLRAEVDGYSTPANTGGRDQHSDRLISLSSGRDYGLPGKHRHDRYASMQTTQVYDVRTDYICLNEVGRIWMRVRSFEKNIGAVSSGGTLTTYTLVQVRASSYK